MTTKSTEFAASVGAHKDKHNDKLLVAVNRFKQAIKKHIEFTDKAARNQDFVFGEQWSPEDRAANEANGKPTLTINITLSTVNAIYNEYSKIKADMTTKSTGKAVHDNSVMLNKVIRNVLQQNNYSEQEADFFLDAIVTGRAWFSIVIADDEDPIGKISIKVEDYNNIVLSVDAADYDPDTWPELFYFDEYTREELEEEFGKKNSDMVQFSLQSDLGEFDYLKNLRTFGEGDETDDNEQTEGTKALDKTIVVTREYFVFTDAYTFVDDDTTDYYQVPKSDFKNKAEAVQVATDSNLSLYTSRMKRIRFIQFTGMIVLKEEWLPYKHFTKYPLFTYFSKGRTMSVVDNVISPQEQLNKGESQELHIVNSTSNGGWQMEEDSLVNLTHAQLEKQGNKAGIVLVRRRGTAPLDKIHPNQVPTGISNLGNKAANNLFRASGVNEGMMGITKTNDSSKLLDGKKDSGQGLLQRVFDNLKRSQKYMLRGVVDIIQEYYTEPRILRYSAKDEDGEQTEEVAINQVTAAGKISNDVSLGRYDFVITWAPKSDVLNDIEFDKMVRMKEVGINIPDSILVSKTQLSNKNELVASLRRMEGLDKTPQELEKDQLIEQITIETAKLELQELQSKVAVNNATAMLRQAEAQDVSIGQNQRFLTTIMAEKESDQLNAGLRATLSEGSNDSTILKTILTNNAKAQEQAKANTETKDD
jgi:hypothetical protein